MGNFRWKTQEEYEAEFGTQAEQAAKERVCSSAVDGPWRLERKLDEKTVALDNSVRSTSREIQTLQDREYERTGIRWDVAAYK